MSKTMRTYTWDEYERMSAQELETHIRQVWHGDAEPLWRLLDMKRNPEFVRKLPDGNIEFLFLWDENGNRCRFEDACEGYGDVYTPDLIRWVAEKYYAPWYFEEHYGKKPKKKLKTSPASVPAAPSLATVEDSSEFAAARSAGRALAASVAEAKYDTNEELRIAWERHLAGQDIRTTPEEAKRRFIEAHVTWKTQGAGMLPSADAAFFQTHEEVFRL
jgi:hypothetical protein